MGSKSTRDRDSPSASSSILPQLRGSRRGSLASLTNTTQLDKETLSQALDQIHSTASQSEALTTFNEYTSPPPSSSGSDSKGIASELQGGLSGLYTRLRASVGNVKDIVIPGGDDAVGEAISVKSSKGAIQVSAQSSQSVPVPYPVPKSVSAEIHRVSVSSSEHQSPVSTKIHDVSQIETNTTTQSSKDSMASTGVSSKSVIVSNTTLKSPPVSLTQASQPTVISPELAQVNISAIKRSGNFDPQLSSLSNDGLVLPHGAARSASGHTPQSGSAMGAAADHSSVSLPKMQTSEIANSSVPDLLTGDSEETKRSAVFARQGPLAGGSEAERSDSKVSQNTVRLLSNEEREDDNEAAIASSSDGEENVNEPPRVIATAANEQDDVFQSSDQQNGVKMAKGTTKMAKYQHIELPLRKVLAPPQVSNTHSPKSSLSQASSSDVNIDILVDSLPHKHRQSESKRRTNQSDRKSNTANLIASAPFHDHSLKNMKVFSQVKNRVLNKEYWMKDENARDCFYCGDPFSTFRRKHHCRKFSRIDPFCPSCLAISI